MLERQVLFQFFAASAFATDPNCPGTMQGACGGRCALIQVSSFEDRVYCDFSGKGAAVEAYAVVDLAQAGVVVYTVTGTDPLNSLTSYCCTFDDDPAGRVYEVKVVGSDFDDILQNNFTPIANLDFVDLGNVIQLVGLLRGRGGDDFLEGSDSTTAMYLDSLDGMNHSDTIYAGDGLDSITGGNDTDFCYGEDGDDFVIGGYGVDTLVGGDGDDLLWADDAVNLENVGNFMQGGPGTDSLVGSNGPDVLCGGGGTNDELFGIGGADMLWAPPASVTPSGSNLGAGSHCGAYPSQGASWAGPYCIYDLASNIGLGCP